MREAASQPGQLYAAEFGGNGRVCRRPFLVYRPLQVEYPKRRNGPPPPPSTAPQLLGRARPSFGFSPKAVRGRAWSSGPEPVPRKASRYGRGPRCNRRPHREAEYFPVTPRYIHAVVPRAISSHKSLYAVFVADCLFVRLLILASLHLVEHPVEVAGELLLLAVVHRFAVFSRTFGRVFSRSATTSVMAWSRNLLSSFRSSSLFTRSARRAGHRS